MTPDPRTQIACSVLQLAASSFSALRHCTYCHKPQPEQHVQLSGSAEERYAGIPYALPPVGPGRFAAATLSDGPWPQGRFDALWPQWPAVLRKSRKLHMSYGLQESLVNVLVVFFGGYDASLWMVITEIPVREACICLPIALKFSLYSSQFMF